MPFYATFGWIFGLNSRKPAYIFDEWLQDEASDILQFLKY